MVTFVGTQNSFVEALQCLIELDYNAVEAYQTAIDRLESKVYKSQLEELCDDHKRHIEDSVSHSARR